MIAVVALAAGCSSECPCGRTFEADAFDPYGEPIGANHPRGIHCICRCGDGDEVLEDPAIDCSIYEGACLAPGFEPAEYRCR